MATTTIDLSGRLLADDVVETSDERDALAAVREVSGATNGPLERHSLR